MLVRLIHWLLFDQTLSIHRLDEQEKPQLLEIFNAARRSAGCFNAARANMVDFERQIQGESVYVAEIGGRIAGFVSISAKDGFIHHLYVCPRFQGRGLGKALLAMCEQRYGRPLSLKCVSANRRALGFYRHLGWVTRGYGAGPDGPWEHLWLGCARRVRCD